MYFGIKVYRLTFVNWETVFGIGLIGGITISYLIFKKYKTLFKYSGLNLILFFIMQVTVSWSFIFASLFLLSNFQFADSNKTSVNFKIEEADFLPIGGRKHRVKRENQPTFEIEYKNWKKELVFYSQYFDQREYYKSIDATIQNGFFGYDVITNKELIK